MAPHKKSFKTILEEATIPQIHRYKTAEISDEIFQKAEISAKKFHRELGKRKDRDLLGKIHILKTGTETPPPVVKIARIHKDPQKRLLPALAAFLPAPQKVSQNQAKMLYYNVKSATQHVHTKVLTIFM